MLALLVAAIRILPPALFDGDRALDEDIELVEPGAARSQELPGASSTGAARGLVGIELVELPGASSTGAARGPSDVIKPGWTPYDLALPQSHT